MEQGRPQEVTQGAGSDQEEQEEKNLEDIEKACLQRLRIKYNCEERESKCRKTKHVEEEDDLIDSDHEADWMA